MDASCANLPKGPALLARAGVGLADAQWLYRQQRAGPAGGDPSRLQAIRRKVQSFVAGDGARPRAGPACA